VAKDKVTRQELYPLLMKAAEKMREEMKQENKKK
jgi:hypothetical protein